MAKVAIKIAHVAESDVFYFTRGKRMVSLPGQFIADIIGCARETITMGQVRAAAETIFLEVCRLGGRVEVCEEQSDPDRKCNMDLWQIDKGGNVIPKPLIPGLDENSYGEHSDGWKEEEGG